MGRGLVMSLTPVVTESRSAGELLAWGREMIETPLRDAVLGLPEVARTVVGYHFGWWDRHGRPVNGKRGKALRPTVLLLSASAVGGRPEELTRVAAAVELVHNFSLVHDDVMDGDRTRHHRPTVWHVFGMDQAILAGDAMLALATSLVAACAGPPAALAVEWLSRCVVRLCEGQYGDLGFERREDVTLPECLDMVAGKTSALLECSCALGALLAGAGDHRVDLLRAFGRDLGVAFQLVDDLLGIWGDAAVTGKPVGADLARRKKTLPVVAALASGTAAGGELSALYHGPGLLTPAQVARAAELVEAAGGRAWARAEATARLAAASAHLDAACCAPRAGAELLALIEFVTRRDR
jgi:geranylgeranyl diphosphate synthase type I